MEMFDVSRFRKKIAESLEDGSFKEWLPEVERLKGVNQPPEHHAEGDAFIHTMLAVNAVPDNADERVFWAVLLHDIGKAETTVFEDGKWRSKGHSEKSAEKVPEIMKRLGRGEIAEDVEWLVKHHNFMFRWGIKEGNKITKKQQDFINHPLFPLLLKVCQADIEGSHSTSEKSKRQIFDYLKQKFIFRQD